MTSVQTRGYSDGDHIGKGAFGSVRKSKKGDAVIALKEVKLGVTMPLPTAEYEGKCMKKLGFHKNILILVDEFTERQPSTERYYLASEYCLCSIIDLQKAKIQLDLHDIKAMFHQMLEGLDYIHSKGIIHRDIKPENVFVSAAGLLKIADFGLAVIIDKHSKYRDIAGTVHYNPPEMLLLKDYNTQVDVWSLGCVFARMCMKDPLFRGRHLQDQLEVILKRCTDAPTVPYTVSTTKYRINYPVQPKNKLYNHLKNVGIDDTSVATLIRDMLIVDPQKRPTAGVLLKEKMFEESSPTIKTPAYYYLLQSRGIHVPK